MMNGIEKSIRQIFKCSHPGCNQNGNFFPVICVPYQGRLARAHKPFTIALRIPMCEQHAEKYPLEVFMNAENKENLKRLTDERSVNLDINCAYIVPVGMKIQDYMHLHARKERHAKIQLPTEY